MTRLAGIRRRSESNRLPIDRSRRRSHGFHERAGRRRACLFQHALAQLALIPGFLAAPERQENLHKLCPGRFVMRLQLQERAQMRERLPGPGLRALDERSQDLQMQRPQLRALRDAPGMKLVAVVKIKPCQEFPSEPTGQRG